MLYLILANIRHLIHFIGWTTLFFVIPADIALLLPIDGLSYYYPEGHRHQIVQTLPERNHESTEKSTTD